MMLQIFLGDKQIGSIPVNAAKSIDKNYLSKKKLLLVEKYKDEIVRAIHNPTFYLSAESTMVSTIKSPTKTSTAGVTLKNI
jgi:hypothetical protein